MSNSEDKTKSGDTSTQIKKEAPKGVLGIKRERAPSEERPGSLLDKLRKRQKLSHSRGSSQTSIKEEKTSAVKAEPRRGILDCIKNQEA